MRRTKNQHISCGHRQITRYSHNYKGARTNFCLPANLTSSKEILAGAIPSPIETATQNTLFPYTPILGRAEQQEIFRSHVMSTAQRNASLWRGGGHPGKRWSPAFCLECIAGDKRQHGTSFWRREHLLHIIDTCPHHGSPLYDYCGRCLSGMRHSYDLDVPLEYCCANGLQSRRDGASNTGLKLSKFAFDMLNASETEAMTGEIFSRVVRERLLDNQIISGSRLRRREAAMVLNSTLPANALQALPDVTTSRNFAKMLRGENSFSNISTALSVAYVLFDDFQSMAKAVAQTSIGQSESARSDTIARRYARLTPAERQAVTQRFVETHGLNENMWQQEGRDKLSRQIGWYSFTWLSRYAPQYVPRAKEPSNHCYQGKPDAANLPFKSDGNLAKHIERRSHELRAANGVARISRRLLLEGFPSTSLFKRRQHRLPQAAAALVEHEETPKEWRLRVTDELLRKAEVLGIGALPSGAAVRQLSVKQLKRVCERIRGRIKERTSTA